MMKHLYLIMIALAILPSCKSNDKPAVSESQNIQKQTDSVTKTAVANTPAQIMDKTEVPVLCYHRIENGRNDEYTVSPASFEEQIKALADSGFNTITPSELYDYLLYNKKLPNKPLLISFDDSRVEHATIAAPTLEKYGFRGVFFIMTITYNKKNYMTTAQIADLAKRGHTVGMHSWDHTMLTKYKDNDWKIQVEDPARKLSEITGKPVDCWAHPYGIFNHASITELSKYMKISFALSTKRDSLQPLQCVRRMIVPQWTTKGMMRAMKKTFAKK